MTIDALPGQPAPGHVDEAGIPAPSSAATSAHSSTAAEPPICVTLFNRGVYMRGVLY